MYTPGPVAAGLQVELEIEIFAMVIGEEGTDGREEISHDIEILTETETILLPVRATVLATDIYECRPQGYPQGGMAAAVWTVSTKPKPRFRITLPENFLANVIITRANTILSYKTSKLPSNTRTDHKLAIPPSRGQEAKITEAA
eukprot:XP_027310728.1 sperm-associated antigen 17-like [Anas platyrhynchos]